MEGSGNEACFDRNTMLERMGGDADLLTEVVALFLEEGPGLLGTVRDAVERESAEDLERAAHSLKGALLNMAADPVARVALELEERGRSGDTSATGPLLADLEAKMVRLREELGGG